MRYKKEMDQAGLNAVLMPVPRFLSSSCGTCVKLSDVTRTLPAPTHPDEVESIVELSGPDQFTILFRNH